MIRHDCVSFHCQRTKYNPNHQKALLFVLFPAAKAVHICLLNGSSKWDFETASSQYLFYIASKTTFRTSLLSSSTTNWPPYFHNVSSEAIMKLHSIVVAIMNFWTTIAVVRVTSSETPLNACLPPLYRNASSNKGHNRHHFCRTPQHLIKTFCCAYPRWGCSQ